MLPCGDIQLEMQGLLKEALTPSCTPWCDVTDEIRDTSDDDIIECTIALTSKTRRHGTRDANCDAYRQIQKQSVVYLSVYSVSYSIGHVPKS